MNDSLARLRTTRVGLLFAGGSSRASFQIGVAEALTNLGIQPAACLGVSAGAWNAAAVAVGNTRRLRAYWRFFCRMPYIDLTNVFRPEHSPFIWTRLHQRAFERYVGSDRIRSDSCLPLYVGVTRLKDLSSVVFDVRQAADPLKLLLATNYLPPFYTHPVVLDAEAYGDGGLSDNIPYRELLERDCDMVVVVSSKGESEGGIYRNPRDCDHTIPPELADRVVVIRPRHRLPVSFTERRWERLRSIADLGALRTREVLLGETHPETELRGDGLMTMARLTRLFGRAQSLFPARRGHHP